MLVFAGFSSSYPTERLNRKGSACRRKSSQKPNHGLLDFLWPCQPIPPLRRNPRLAPAGTGKLTQTAPVVSASSPRFTARSMASRKPVTSANVPSSSNSTTAPRTSALARPRRVTSHHSSRSQNSFTHGPYGCLCAIADCNLPQNVLDVFLDRLDADFQ